MNFTWPPGLGSVIAIGVILLLIVAFVFFKPTVVLVAACVIALALARFC